MNIGKLKKNIGMILAILIAIFFFILPLLRLLLMSFNSEIGFTFEHYKLLLSETRTIQAISNTIIIGISSTIISLILGTWFAFLVTYTDIKYKRLVETLVLAPFIIPSYIITLSWSGLFSSRGTINMLINEFFNFKINIYSLGGIILVLGICNAPIVYLNVKPMLRKIPRDLEWASRVSGFGLWKTFRNINFKLVTPAVASGGMLAFLSAIDNFAVPAFLGIPAGIPLLSTYIYEKVIGFGPTAFNSAAVLSVLLSSIAIVGTTIQSFMVYKSSGNKSIKEDYSIRIELGKNSSSIEWINLVFLTVLNIVPLLTMIISSFFPAFGAKTIERFTLKNYEFVFSNRGIGQAFFNSIVLASLASFICIVIGTLIAYAKVKRNSKTAIFVEQGASLTYAIPGIVLALAMIFHWTKVPGIYGSIAILLISYITRYMVLQIKSSSNALLAVDNELEEASYVCGRNYLRTWIDIIIPLTIKPILSGTFMIFMFSLTELTLSSMLAAAGTKTIGLSIFSLQQGGDYQLATALSAVIVMGVVLLYIVKNIVDYMFNHKKYNANRKEVPHVDNI